MNRRLCVMVAVLAGALLFAGVAQSQPGGGPGPGGPKKGKKGGGDQTPEFAREQVA